MIRNTKEVSVNDVQRKLCLTHKTRMELYSRRVSANLERRLTKLRKIAA